MMPIAPRPAVPQASAPRSPLVEVFTPTGVPALAEIARSIERAVTVEFEKALADPVTAERLVAHVAHEARVAAAFERFMGALRRKMGLRE